MVAKNYLIVPHFSAVTYNGQTMLDRLQEQGELMTASASELRAEGLESVTLDQIIERTRRHRPGFSVDPSLFRFTGKRVVVSEKDFFSWYEFTPEGKALLASNDRVAPGIGHRFGVIIRK